MKLAYNLPWKKEAMGGPGILSKGDGRLHAFHKTQIERQPAAARMKFGREDMGSRTQVGISALHI
jgi:hypothetical protein